MPENNGNTHKTLRRGFAGDALAADLRTFVKDNQPHEPLASERALARDYDISYSTVRKVTQQLVDEGLVYKVHGRGLFVAEHTAPARDEKNTVLYLDDWVHDDHPYCVRRFRAVLDGAEEMDLRVEARRLNIDSQCLEDDLYEEARRPELAGMIVPLLTPALSRRLRALNPDLHLVTIGTDTPPPGVASVQHNHLSIGYQAGAWLMGNGVRSILAVLKHGDLLPGLHGALAEAGEAPELHTVIGHPDDAIDGALTAIHKEQPDGLFFSDDRFARSVLDDLALTAPRCLEGASVISCANAGEEFLPPWVARLNIDGYEVGMFAMNLLKAMIEDRTMENPIVRIEPRLIEPAAAFRIARVS